jgi:hypothetical protein
VLGAVRARVHDPAWLLGRQRQIGEWAAQDRGSAVRADLALRTSRLTHYRPWSDIAAHVLADGVPLEAVVEAETTPPPAASGAYLTARAGQAFLHSLGTDLGRRYGAAYVDHQPLQLPGADVLDTLDADTRAVLDVLAGRVPDGEALYAELATALRPDTGTPALPAEPPVDPDDADDVVLAVGTGWPDSTRCARRRRPRHGTRTG